jgi:cellulase/cellobiase CelA1
VKYTVANQWQGGFQGGVDITNTGSATVSGWTLKWTFAGGQVINQLWNGKVTQSGAAVTVTDQGYNKEIRPNGTVGFGFTASWAGTNAKPVAFTLNDRPCAVQ